MYGDRFTREFGNEPTDTWVATIARMSDQEIIASLKGLAEKGGPHPPTLGEFTKAGKPETGSPRYLGANPINYTEQRIAGTLPPPIETSSAVSPLARTGLMRIAAGHPEYRGHFCDPYSLPGQPKGERTENWLRAGAPADVVEYCRAGVAWSKQHPAIALPGFLRLSKVWE